MDMSPKNVIKATIGLVLLFGFIGACYPIMSDGLNTLNDSGIPFISILAGGVFGMLVGAAIIYAVLRVLGFAGK